MRHTVNPDIIPTPSTFASWPKKPRGRCMKGLGNENGAGKENKRKYRKKHTGKQIILITK